MYWSSLIATMIGLIIGLGISRLIYYQATLREPGIFAPWDMLFILGYILVFHTRYLPEIWRDYVLSGMLIFVAAIFWTYTVTWLWRKRQTGSLLLNLGRLSTQENSLFIGLLFVIFGIWRADWLIHQATLLINTEGFSSSTLFYLSLVIAVGSLGIFFLVGGLTKLEIREHGICWGFDLIKWTNISSYWWEGKKGNTLTIRLKKHFPFYPHRSLPIPIAQKDNMNSILQEKLQAK